MIVSDITTRVQRTFGDEAGVQVDPSDIIRWVNDGVRTILYGNESLLQKIGLADSVANQSQYSVPADCLILRSINFMGSGDSSYLKLKGLTLNEFDEYMNGWDGGVYGAGTPVVFMIYADKITFFPTPDTSILQAIKIYYNRTPVDVVDSSGTPDIPSIYHEALVKYCLQQAYELDEDIDATALKEKQFVDDVKLMRGRSEWKQQDVYPRITVLADDM